MLISWEQGWLVSGKFVLDNITLWTENPAIIFIITLDTKNTERRICLMSYFTYFNDATFRKFFKSFIREHLADRQRIFLNHFHNQLILWAFESNKTGLLHVKSHLSVRAAAFQIYMIFNTHTHNYFLFKQADRHHQKNRGNYHYQFADELQHACKRGLWPVYPRNLLLDKM